MSKLLTTVAGGIFPGMFGGGGEAQQAPGSTIINNEAPKKPRTTRMPTETDPAMLEAAQRTRNAALARRGRLSTIMTDSSRDAVGSSGKSLGA
jgi:hypothetical protein